MARGHQDLDLAATKPSETSDKTPDDFFFQAWRLMTSFNSKQFIAAIDVAVNIQRAIVKQAAALLDGQDLIHRYHRIYYAFLKATTIADRKDTSRDEIFSKPAVIGRLGRFIMQVKVIISDSAWFQLWL